MSIRDAVLDRPALALPRNLTLALAGGASFEGAARLANHAGGIVLHRGQSAPEHHSHSIVPGGLLVTS